MPSFRQNHRILYVNNNIYDGTHCRQSTISAFSFFSSFFSAVAAEEAVPQPHANDDMMTGRARGRGKVSVFGHNFFL